ncbi:MAG: hypothetical protein QMC09_18395, partial [Thauera sp.]
RSYMKIEAATVPAGANAAPQKTAFPCRSAGRRECGLTIARPRRRALRRQIRGCRRSYMKIEAATVPAGANAAPQKAALPCRSAGRRECSAAARATLDAAAPPSARLVPSGAPALPARGVLRRQ